MPTRAKCRCWSAHLLGSLCVGFARVRSAGCWLRRRYCQLGLELMQLPDGDLNSPSYRGYRFPREIIAHCAWLYFRFSPSLRDIQELMLERGVVVSRETIRLWCLKFVADYARRLRRGGRVNNRAENSHQPTRHRERQMRRFKSMKHARRFLSAHGQVSNHFRC
jgi:putative transposase